MCIGNCNDPFVTYLKENGYNAIRLPRTNVRPLQILGKTDRDLTWLGELADVFTPKGDVSIPTIENDIGASGISGKRTGEMSVGLGLSLLGSVIGAMGGAKVGLDVTYKEANSITFEFPEVLSDQITLTKLDRYLGSSDINPGLVTISQLLDADEIYVITNTIKSKKFSVQAVRSDNSSLEVSVPAVQEVLGANVKASSSGKIDGNITYEGSVPLVFGFQAVQLYYDNGAYTSFKPIDAGKIAAKALSKLDTTKNNYLVTDEALTRLKMR